MTAPAAPGLGTLSWRGLEPPALPALPTMSTVAERRFYYWLTRERFQERGAVVELGTWLGGGTQYLAAGLRDRGSDGRVVAIDRFLWMGEFYEEKFRANLGEGDDFEPLFRQNLGPLMRWIAVQRGEIARLRWHGGPIEIMLVDAPKLLPDVLGFLATFGPSLIPGVSLLAFQDYLHNASYSLAAVLAEHADSLRLVDVVLPGTTAVFELVRPLVLTPERLEQCRLDRWTEAKTIARWRRIAEPLPAEAQASIALSLPMMLHDQGFHASAVAEAAKLRDLPIARHRLGKWARGPLFWTYRGIYDAFGIDGGDPSPAMLLKDAQVEAKAGRIEPAIAACRRALALAPGHPEATVLLARLERERRGWRGLVRRLRRRLLGPGNRLRRQTRRMRRV